MQASLSAGSEGNSLDDQQPQLIISMLGVMFKTEVPLDFVSTDGVIYNLYRFHEKKLLKYARLPAEKVGSYHRTCMLPSPDCCMAYLFLSALQHPFLASGISSVCCNMCA